jgi:phosphoserine phosphatase
MNKRLLVFDVEGTLFKTEIRLEGTDLTSTIWQMIAWKLGPSAVDEEVASHRRWREGGYTSYIDWMKDTIRIHQKYGLSRKVFDEIISAAQYNDGVADTLSRIDRSRFEPVLVTGGFLELASRVNRDFGFAHAFAACSYLFDANEMLSGFNLLPCDFDGKIGFIKLMLHEYGLTSADWAFVGDGLNDVSIARAAPLSIGFRPHAALAEVVDHTITRFDEILSLI